MPHSDFLPGKDHSSTVQTVFFFDVLFPSAENAPRLCTLPSLNECSSHCVGHRLIKFAVDSVIVPPLPNPAHPVPLQKALIGLVCWCRCGSIEVSATWMEAARLQTRLLWPCFNGDDIASSVLVIVLGLFVKIKSKGTEHYNGEKLKDYATFFFLGIQKYIK